MFDQPFSGCREVADSRWFRFRNKRLSLDATVIDLCAEMFGLGDVPSDQERVKLLSTLDHDAYLPTALVITEGKRHEGTWPGARRLRPARFWSSIAATWTSRGSPG